MGFFDSIGDFFTKTIPKTAKKAARGIKDTVAKAKRGLKSTGEWFEKRGKEASRLKDASAWKEGFKRAGEIIQMPAKKIAEWDKKKGLGQYMGDFSGFSPLTLGSSIALAVPSGVGYFSQLAGDDKLQKKLKSGDADTIMDTTFAGLGVIPFGAVGSGAKAGATGARSLAKASKGLVKSAAKKMRF